MTLPPFPAFCQDVLGLDVSTRQPMLAFMACLDGEALTSAQMALVETHTGGRPYVLRPRGFTQGVVQVGRQGGKSETCAARMVYKGAGAAVAGHRNRWYAAVAQDHRAGMRALFGHIKRFMERPLLAPLVTRVTTDTVELEGGNTIAVFPCRPAAWRGLAVHEFAMDEIAHYRSSENIPLDRECWRSALPTLAMTGGRLIALSSPYAAGGLLYDLHKRYFANPESDLLYWQASGPAMNPKLDAAFLQHLRDVDPEGAAAEVDGEFLRNTSALVDEDTLQAAVDEGVTARTPEYGHTYEAFGDFASGAKVGQDSATLAIGHRGPDRVAVLDLVKEWAPPFSVGTVTQEIADICARYRCHTLTADKWAAGFSDEAVRRAGMTYRASDQDKSALYLTFASALTAGQVRLLDSPDLLRQIRGLERRRTPTKDKVDHRPGAHDDVANSACGVLARLAYRPKTTCGAMFVDWI